MKQALQLRVLDFIQRVTIPYASIAWVGIASVDWLATFEIYFSALYLLVVLVVAWNHGAKWGTAVAVLSAANQLTLGVVDGSQFSSPVYFSIDILNWLCAYMIGGYICALLKMSYRRITARAERLNQQMQQRTADLETAHKVLESFAYIAAHDLRAPLRTMAGFSAIVLQKHEATLDQFSVEYLKRIHIASERTGAIIEGMLAARKEFKQVDVSLIELA